MESGYNHVENVKVVQKEPGADLSSVIFADKSPVTTSFGKDIEPQTGSFQLPKVDFVISHGQQETTYGVDGSVSVQHTDKKVDPECSNGVRSADGSEQRFDKTGLCKTIGDVHWGQAVDGIMNIDLGKNVKIGLDKNFNLVRVQGEHSAYKAGEGNINPMENVAPKVVAPATEPIANHALEKTNAKATQHVKNATEHHKASAHHATEKRSSVSAKAHPADVDFRGIY